MSCQVTSTYPNTTLEWRRVDGKPLSSRILQLASVGQSHNRKIYFSIQNVDQEDFGAYECVVSNRIGIVSKSVVLKGK